jgi:uncharacterized protein DUF6883
MRLPNRKQAVVDERKIRDYLLSPTHPVGRFKARFFAKLGFRSEDWSDLETSLLKLAHDGDAQLVVADEFGRKFLIAGTLAGLSGRRAEVASIWIIPHGDDIPRLVTVYPIQS